MRRFLRLSRVAVLLTFGIPGPPMIVADGAITDDQAAQILDQLQQIRALLEKQAKAPMVSNEPSPVRATIALQDAPSLGAENAPVALVEFTDFQCPYCERFQVESFDALKKNYIDTGKVRFYSRDLPLDFHKNAMQAAQAARCAAEVGKFWEMRDWMQRNPAKLDLQSVVIHGQSLGMDELALNRCISSGKYRDVIRSEAKDAITKGAHGTPAFILGISRGTSEIEGDWISGVRPYQFFEERINSLLH
jgi:protein-disulfide isomerase